jgi:hypothetical protein
MLVVVEVVVLLIVTLIRQEGTLYK